MKEISELQRTAQSQQHCFLIAEDNLIDIEIVRAHLQEAYSGQFTLDSVDSVAGARLALSKKHYSALILDMNLPGHHQDQDIIDLCESCYETPVIILTGETDPAIAIDSLKVGAQDFLTKNSITPQILARSLRYAQERKKIELALRNSVADIADRNEQLKNLVHTDHLTKLANRAHFENALEETIYKAQRAKQKFALLYLDLNNFKKVNDNFGHSVGDELLKQVAYRLQETVRSSDFIARIGGDEFIIFTDFLQETAEIYQLLDRVKKTFNSAFIIDNKEIQTQPSIGVAFYPQADTSEMLLKHADFAMYEGKELRSDSGSVCFYTKEMECKYDRRLQLEAQLDTALEQDEFCAHFQKITSLQHNDTLIFEALLRWNSSKLGAVSPAEFIPIFENSPVINQLTKIVLKQAKELITKMAALDQTVTSIKVNVTASQLSNSQFCNMFLSWLQNEELLPNVICIELTESQVVKNTESCLLQIKQLRAAGVKVAIDDFGAGYSSLQYLLDFNVDYLKLDISLIRGIDEQKRSQALVAGIIEMGHRLDMKIVAEGVETEAEYLCCKQLNCDMIQGYFFHKPQSITDIIAAYKTTVDTSNKHSNLILEHSLHSNISAV
ncbi:MAG: EAL domain-containing protein [Oceanospirillaceae bacterium]